MARTTVQGSFRDPSGFLFLRDGVLYRQINPVYFDHFYCLHQSGLYQTLVSKGYLIPHQEVVLQKSASYCKVIRPELVPFISYPYELSFSQLKDAALLTLEIQKQALEKGMSLKDCSAYNIQFKNGKPILIDTLSFERYREGAPWVAYRQFCQHFLAPLALMSLRDVRLAQFSRIELDGVPLDLTSTLLPGRSWLKFGLLTHVHLQARFQRKYQDTSLSAVKGRMSRMGFLGLVDSLYSAVNKLKWRPPGTEWADYYAITNYTPGAFAHKQEIVGKYLDEARPQVVWDLGANTGVFSRIACGKSIFTVSFDSDPVAVEKNYLECKSSGESYILPLLMDLSNPSSGIGWDHEERMSLRQRGPADTVLALALIHHLALSNNVPLEKLAAFFAKVCRTLVIEFVPMEDSQVQILLASREDVFPDYTRARFEEVFGRFFETRDRQNVKETVRTMYLMKNKTQL